MFAALADLYFIHVVEDFIHVVSCITNHNAGCI